MAPSPIPSKLLQERSSVKVSVSTLDLDLPPPRHLAAAVPRNPRRPAASAHARSAALAPGKCAHADCQTDPALLEPLEVPVTEAAAQTDGLLRPIQLQAQPLPLQPAGTDASTQVTEDDLVDFERDMAPALCAAVAPAPQLSAQLAECEALVQESVQREQSEATEVPVQDAVRQETEQVAVAASAPASPSALSGGSAAESPLRQPESVVQQELQAEQEVAAGGEAKEQAAGAEAGVAAPDGTADAQEGSVAGSTADNVAEAPALEATDAAENGIVPCADGQAADESPAAGSGQEQAAGMPAGGSTEEQAFAPEAPVGSVQACAEEMGEATAILLDGATHGEAAAVTTATSGGLQEAEETSAPLLDGAAEGHMVAAVVGSSGSLSTTSPTAESAAAPGQGSGDSFAAAGGEQGAAEQDAEGGEATQL